MKYSVALLSALAALTMTSCGGGGSSSDPDVISPTPEGSNIAPNTYRGFLVDAAVVGATYNCGGKTGTTEAEGKFECPTQEVTFKIGQTVLGTIKSIPEDNNVFPQDIVGVDRNDTSHPQVRNMAILMQSLDSDQEPSNGIQLSREMTEQIVEQIDLTSIIARIEEKLKAQFGEEFALVEEEKAMAHLGETIASKKLPSDPSVTTDENSSVTTDTNNTIPEIDDEGLFPTPDTNSTDLEEPSFDNDFDGLTNEQEDVNWNGIMPPQIHTTKKQILIPK